MISEAYNIDCMEYMRTIPDKYFDLAVVDPPYFSGPERRVYYGPKTSPIGVKRIYSVSKHWMIPGKEYFEELLRVSKHFIIWGCNYHSSFSDCEIAATDLIASVRLFPFMWNGMNQGRSVSDGRMMQGNKALNEKRIHPTQKPVALYTWIYQKFAKRGWKIIDTHLGSGSSRIAAHFAQLDFVGCEIDREYYKASCARYEKECLGKTVTPDGLTIVEPDLLTLINQHI